MSKIAQISLILQIILCKQREPRKKAWFFFCIDWEQRKLGEVGAVAMCKRIFKEQTTEEGDIPFFKIGTFGGEADAFISRELFEEYKSKYPYPSKGAILISASGSIGRTVEFTGKNEYFQDSNIVWLTHDDRLQDSFLKYLYATITWAGIEGSTIKRLYNDNILKTQVMIPSSIEQTKLGTLFSRLDNLITLHQRKQKYLYLIFEERKIPQKMANDWEQRKLGEIANIQKGQQLGKAEMNDHGYYYVLNGGIEPSGFSDRYNTPANTISISEGGNSCGYVTFNLECFWSGGHNYTLQNPQLDTIYLYQWLKKQEKTIMALRVGSGLPNIQKSALQDVVVLYPNNNEQRMIATILMRLDNLITLHQRKRKGEGRINLNPHEEEEQQKSANDWEQRKVGELSEKTYGGGTPSTQNEGFWNGEIPWIQSSDIEEGRLYGVTPKKFISQDGLNQSAAQLIPKNSIAIITRVGVGKLAFMPFSYATSQDFVSLSRLTVDPFFTVYACYRRLQTDLNSVQGTSIKGITKEELLSKVIFFPDEPEQRLIGGLFRRLDDLITLHQRKDMVVQYEKKAIGGNVEKQKMANDWEQRKVGDVVEVQSGRDYKHLGSGSIPVYGTGGLMLYVDKALSYSNDAIGIGRKGTIDKPYVLRAPFWTVDTLFYAVPKAKNDLSFVYCLFQRIDWKSKDESTGVPSLSKQTINDSEVKVAAEQEQRTIGAYFSKLDDLITLHQRKGKTFYAFKKQDKSAHFRRPNKNGWEQRKLGEIAKAVTRNEPTSDAPIMMITANNGFIEQSERYAFDNAGESLKKYILLEKGELAYNHGASKMRPYGSCFALTTVEKARIPFVYHCFSVGQHDSEFVSIELNGAEVEKQLRRIVSSGARMDGLLNISFDEYTSIEVLLPIFEEQHKIATCFRTLDNLITLHQRE